MGLKSLIENQTIIIDDHKRGNREIKNWDDIQNDVHIDKKTNFRINGKKQNFRIRIPINSDRPIKIENTRKNTLADLPGRFQKEIREAFEDKVVREQFITDLISTLRNYHTVLDNEERVRQILKHLSRHFDLRWTEEKITTYRNDIQEVYTQTYRDDDGRVYFITLDRQKIKIGENNGYERHQKSIRRI